jgi:hypothetical protein
MFWQPAGTTLSHRNMAILEGDKNNIPSNLAILAQVFHKIPFNELHWILFCWGHLLPCMYCAEFRSDVYCKHILHYNRPTLNLTLVSECDNMSHKLSNVKSQY